MMAYDDYLDREKICKGCIHEFTDPCDETTVSEDENGEWLCENYITVSKENRGEN